MSSKEPIFNIKENSVLIVIGLLIAAHVVKSFWPDEDSLLLNFALFPIESAWVAFDPFGYAFRLISHGFLHADNSHLLMNSGGLLIFGIITFRGVRAKLGYSMKGLVSFWGIFWLGVAIGGLFQWGYWAYIQDLGGSAVGASGGVSALFATTGWVTGGREGMIKFGLAYIVLNIMMVYGMGNVAWAAHAGGFVAGALLAPYWVKPKSATLSASR